jgi:hypothetical protein
MHTHFHCQSSLHLSVQLRPAKAPSVIDLAPKSTIHLQTEFRRGFQIGQNPPLPGVRATGYSVHRYQEAHPLPI